MAFAAPAFASKLCPSMALTTDDLHFLELIHEGEKYKKKLIPWQSIAWLLR